MRLKRFSVIASAGGAALDSAIVIAPDVAKHIVLATDRSCAAELLVEKHGLEHFRFTGNTNVELSVNLRQALSKLDVACGVTLYSRIITHDLFNHVPIYNIHPSLLPGFPGLSAVKKAYEKKVRILGATLHRVDAGIDTGPIITQISTIVDPNVDIEAWNKISFLQKTYLMLVCFSIFIKETRPGKITCSHLIPQEWHSKFLEFQYSEGFSLFSEQS